MNKINKIELLKKQVEDLQNELSTLQEKNV